MFIFTMTIKMCKFFLILNAFICFYILLLWQGETKIFTTIFYYQWTVSFELKEKLDDTLDVLGGVLSSQLWKHCCASLIFGHSLTLFGYQPSILISNSRTLQILSMLRTISPFSLKYLCWDPFLMLSTIFIFDFLEKQVPIIKTYLLSTKNFSLNNLL